MTTRMYGLMLLVLGATILAVARGELLLRYVRPGARVQVVAGAVAVAALGCALVAVGGRRRCAESDGRPGLAMWGLVLTAAVVSGAPPALGIAAAAHPPSRPPRPADAFGPLPAGDPVPLTVSDLVLRTVWGGGPALAGRQLQVVGIVARPAPGGFVLARLVITCCAADARPYDVRVRTGPGQTVPRTASWVAVTGRYAGTDPADGIVPLLVAATSRPVPQPADPYG